MNPKEKAVDLFYKMKGFRVKHTHSKRCALIAVDEAIEAEKNVLVKFKFVNEDYKSDYWESVKTEIEKL